MGNLGCPASWSECIPCASGQLCAQECQGGSHEFCCSSGMMYNPDTGTCSASTCSAIQFLCADGYCCANPSGCQGTSQQYCCEGKSPPNADGTCTCSTGSMQCSAGNCCPTGTCPTGTTCPDASQVIVDGCCVSSCPSGQCKGSASNCCPAGTCPTGTTCPVASDVIKDGCCTDPSCTNNCTDGCCNVPCQYDNKSYCCTEGQTFSNGQCLCTNEDVCAQACVGPTDSNGKQSCCHPGDVYNLETGTCFCDPNLNTRCGADDTCCINGGCCGNTQCLPTYQSSGTGNIMGYVPVTSATSNNISIYNMSSNTYVSSIQVQGAIQTLIHPTNGNLYVLSPNTSNSLVTVIDSADDSIIKTITVAGSAVDMVMDSKGTYLYVTSAACGLSITISVVDTSNYTVTNNYTKEMDYANGYTLAISPDDKYLLVSSVNYGRTSGNILIYSLASTPKLPVPNIVLDTQAIVEIVFSADGKTIYALENDAYHPFQLKCSNPLGFNNSKILEIDFSNPLAPAVEKMLTFSEGNPNFASGMAITRDNLFLYVTRQEWKGNGPYTQNEVLYRIDLNNPVNYVATTYYITVPPEGALSSYRQRILISDNGQYLYVPVTNGVYSIDLQDTTAASLISGTGGVGNLTITSPPGSTLMCCASQVLDTTIGNCCKLGNAESPCLFASGTCCGAGCCESGDCCSDKTQTHSVPTGCILPGNRCCHNGTQVVTGGCCPEDPPCGTEPGTSGSCCCGDNLETATEGLCCKNADEPAKWHPTATEPGICCSGLESGDPEVWQAGSGYVCCSGKPQQSSLGLCCPDITGTWTLYATGDGGLACEGTPTGNICCPASTVCLLGSNNNSSLNNCCASNQTMKDAGVCCTTCGTGSCCSAADGGCCTCVCDINGHPNNYEACENEMGSCTGECQVSRCS